MTADAMGCLPVLLLLALPIAEVWAFVQAVDEVGWLASLAGLLAAGLLGGAIVRTQGLDTHARLRAALARGESPGRVLFAGACRLGGGMLLLVPGFLTDAAGLLLLLPPVQWLAWQVAAGRWGGRGRPAGGAGPGPRTASGGFPGGGGGFPGGGVGGFPGGGAPGAGGFRGPRTFVFTWTSAGPGAAGMPPRPGPAAPSPGGVIDAEWTEVPAEGGGDQRALPPGDAPGEGVAGASSKTRT